VQRRILLGGLVVGAFVLTFAFSSRHEDPWRSGAAHSALATARPHEAVATPTGEAAPIVAAMNPTPAVEPPESVASEPYTTPDVRDGRDRAAEHGPRSR
jgi:hypothetical protein